MDRNVRRNKKDRRFQDSWVFWGGHRWLAPIPVIWLHLWRPFSRVPYTTWGTSGPSARLPGPNPTMTLVANSIPFHAASFKAANREQRVPAGGVPAHHSLSRTRSIATAVKTCCRCALACPMYRHRRKPQRRIACACVPSTPARAAYCNRNSSVVCRRRAACNASCCLRVCSPMMRGSVFDRVHCGRNGHGVQSLRANRASGKSGVRKSGVSSSFLPEKTNRHRISQCFDA